MRVLAMHEVCPSPSPVQVIQQHLLAQRQRRGVEVAQRDVLHRVLGGTAEAEAALAMGGTGAGFRSRARLQRTPVKPRPQQQQQSMHPLHPEAGGSGSSGDGVSEEEDLDGWESQEEDEVFVGDDQQGVIWPGLQQQQQQRLDAAADTDIYLGQAPPDLELDPYLGGLAHPDPALDPDLPVTIVADGASPKDRRPQDGVFAVAGEHVVGGGFQGNPPSSRDECLRPPLTHRTEGMDAGGGTGEASAGHAFDDDDDDGVLMFDEEMPFATEMLFDGLHASEEPRLWEERGVRPATGAASEELHGDCPASAAGAAAEELHGVGPAPALRELCDSSQEEVEMVAPSHQPGELEEVSLLGDDDLSRSSPSVLGQTASLMLDLDGLPMAAPGSSSTEARGAVASAPVRCLGSAERASRLLSVHREGPAEAGGSGRVGSEDSEEEEEEEEEADSGNSGLDAGEEEEEGGSEHYSNDEEETWSEKEEEGQEDQQQEDEEEDEEEEEGSDSDSSDAEGKQGGDSVAAAHRSGSPLQPSPAGEGELERQLASAWDGAGACPRPITISMRYCSFYKPLPHFLLPLPPLPATVTPSHDCRFSDEAPHPPNPYPAAQMKPPSARCWSRYGA